MKTTQYFIKKKSNNEYLSGYYGGQTTKKKSEARSFRTVNQVLDYIIKSGYALKDHEVIKMDTMTVTKVTTAVVNPNAQLEQIKSAKIRSIKTRYKNKLEKELARFLPPSERKK